MVPWKGTACSEKGKELGTAAAWCTWWGVGKILTGYIRLDCERLYTHPFTKVHTEDLPCALHLMNKTVAALALGTLMIHMCYEEVWT